MLGGQNVFVYTVAEEQHTLSEGDPVWGVTSLAGEIFLLRKKGRDQVEVYDVITYCALRCLTVPNARRFRPIDMISCAYYYCIYIADKYKYIRKIDIKAPAFTRWALNGRPRGISVNASHNVLVTYLEVQTIKEFSSHGELIREITLPDDIINHCHTIQSLDNTFIVCHGDPGDAVNRVCKISADGRHIVHSHGGQRGSVHGQYNVTWLSMITSLCLWWTFSISE